MIRLRRVVCSRVYQTRILLPPLKGPTTRSSPALRMPEPPVEPTQDYKAEREKRKDARRRDRGGIFKPQEKNGLLDVLMARRKSGRFSPAKVVSLPKQISTSHARQPKKKAVVRGLVARASPSTAEALPAEAKSTSSHPLKRQTGRSRKPNASKIKAKDDNDSESDYQPAPTKSKAKKVTKKSTKTAASSTQTAPLATDPISHPPPVIKKLTRTRKVRQPSQPKEHDLEDPIEPQVVPSKKARGGRKAADDTDDVDVIDHKKLFRKRKAADTDVLLESHPASPPKKQRVRKPAPIASILPERKTSLGPPALNIDTVLPAVIAGDIEVASKRGRKRKQPDDLGVDEGMGTGRRPSKRREVLAVIVETTENVARAFSQTKLGKPSRAKTNIRDAVLDTGSRTGELDDIFISQPMKAGRTLKDQSSRLPKESAAKDRLSLKSMADDIRKTYPTNGSKHANKSRINATNGRKHTDFDDGVNEGVVSRDGPVNSRRRDEKKILKTDEMTSRTPKSTGKLLTHDATANLEVDDGIKHYFKTPTRPPAKEKSHTFHKPLDDKTNLKPSRRPGAALKTTGKVNRGGAVPALRVLPLHINSDDSDDPLDLLAS